jgi:hypothetical protein
MTFGTSVYMVISEVYVILERQATEFLTLQEITLPTCLFAFRLGRGGQTRRFPKIAVFCDVSE